MARKSKQPGGHNPLTAHERKKYTKNVYGTTKARLGQDSQYTFGNCGLSLHPVTDQPVASPSGFIYERSSILEYLLTKTLEIKQRQEDYNKHLSHEEASNKRKDATKRKAEIEAFENTQKVVVAKKQKLEENELKRTSYWLADMQPGQKDPNEPTSLDPRHQLRPPRRPPSPNTRNPLRRKDLIELELKRKGRNDQDPVLCAISEKEISSQQALALITKGDEPAQVVLESIYKDLKIDKEGKKARCPVTGRKIKQVLKLHKGGSSFASEDDNGRSLQATKYRPTMT